MLLATLLGPYVMVALIGAGAMGGCAAAAMGRRFRRFARIVTYGSSPRRPAIRITEFVAHSDFGVLILDRD